MMDLLSDDQAAQLTGGSFHHLWKAASDLPARRGIGALLWNSRLAFRGIFTSVKQLNIAVNVALFGGTVMNNQANLLAINNSL
jgi:hypothetical protein